LQLGIPGAVTYNFSILFTKVSILLFYLRFCDERSFRIIAYAVIVVAVGYSIIGAFGFLYLCRPIPKFIDPTSDGTCANIVVWWLACATLNAATDIVILLLPIRILRPLRVSFAQKVAVMAILMAGGL
jgi:hypothetical protein